LAAAKASITALTAEKDAEIQRMAAEKDAEIQRMAVALSMVEQENELLKTKRGTTSDVSEESSQDTSAAAPAVHDALLSPESSVPGWFAVPALRCPRRTSSLEHDLSSVLEDVISRACGVSLASGSRSAGEETSACL
jgi:hypothetical protein